MLGTKGWASSEQGFVSLMKNFLVDSVGWSYTTVSNTATDVDYAFSSAGEYPGSNDTIYIRLRGYNDHVYLYGYSYFQNDTTYSGQVHNSTYSRVYAGITPPFQYWAMADKDHLKFVLRDVNNEYYYHGYAGLIDTYYDSYNDKLPLLVFGTKDTSAHWSDDNSTVMMTAEPISDKYSVWTVYSPTYATSNRADVCGGYRLLLYYKNNAQYQEVRGSPKGVYRVPDSCAGAGVELLLASGIYYSFNKIGNQNYSYMYGPVGTPPGCS